MYKAATAFVWLCSRDNLVYTFPTTYVQICKYKWRERIMTEQEHEDLEFWLLNEATFEEIEEIANGED